MSEVKVVLIIIMSILVISGIAFDKSEKELKECFMQDVKTKECEYILWKEELRVQKASNRRHGVAPVVTTKGVGVGIY